MFFLFLFIFSCFTQVDGQISRPIETNKTVVITTVLTNPFTMFKPDSDLLVGNDRFEGYAIDLIKLLANSDVFKRDYKVQLVKDGKYGSSLEDGRWNGMVGELLDEEADIAVAPLTISYRRYRVVDFSPPFMTTGLTMMAKKPDKPQFSVFDIFKPFADCLWYAIFAVFILSALIFYAIGRLSPYEQPLSNGAMTVTLLPSSLSGRIAAFAWWMFVFLMVSLYAASLVQSPIVDEKIKPIESVEDLAKQNKIKFGVTGGGSSQEFFEDTKVALYNMMAEKMRHEVPSVFVSNYDKGIRRVRESNGSYIFILDATTNSYVNSRKPCDTIQVGEKLNTKYYGIATPFGSHFKSRIDLAILKLLENGELKKLENKWWYDRGQCQVIESYDPLHYGGVTFYRVAGAFCFLICLMFLALVTAGLERVCDILCKKCRKNQLGETENESNRAKERLIM